MSTSSRKQGVNILLSVMVLLTILNSGYFFVGILKLGIFQWLAFNACSFAGIVYLACCLLHKITGKDYLKAVPLIPLYYYGTMGLFLMPWTESNIVAHVSHIIITLSLLWLLYGLLRERKFEALGVGLLAGTALFVPVFAFIQVYVQQHMKEFVQVLQKM